MTVGRLPSIEGGIQPTIFDAKADILTATAADTPARLAVGSNDQVLTADSSTTTGLKWATPSSGGMTLINTGGTTLSGASVTVSSIPATYIDLYILVVNFVPVTDNSILTMYFNGDNGSKYYRPGATLYSTNQVFNDNYLVAATNQDNGATSYQKSSIQITGYTQSTWKTSLATHISNNATTNTNMNLQFTISASNITAAISSITFLADSGNMTSGTVYVYGVK